MALMIASSPEVMRSPRTVDVEITSKCNLRCLYCYYFDNPEINYHDLPADEWLQFFDELGRLAVMNVCLAGGEPFARKDLPELLEGIVRNRMRFTILSNGTLIDDDIAEFIAATGRCDFVQVSLDGSNPKTHDACRGEGSFTKAVRGLRTLQRYHVPVTVRATINHHNVQDIEKLAQFLLEDLGISGFSINSAGYMGSCRSHANDVIMTREDRQKAMSTLLRLSEKYNGRITASAGPLAEGKHWRKMEAARLKKEATFSIGGRLTACGCPFSKINVRSDGIITPCNMLDHINLGKINADSLQEIWMNHRIMNQLRTRQSIPLTEFAFCNNCEYIPYCTGNCPGLAYSMTGEVNQPSPDACLRKFLAEGGEIP